MKIIDIAYSGNGVAKENGKVVFVPQADIGEEVDVEIVKTTSKFDIGKISEIEKASPFRVTPPCPYYGKCGGCDFQHLTYERELELKRHILQNELKKINFSGEIDVEKCEKIYNYRNKIKLTYKNGELGYISNLTHDFVAVDSCMLAEKNIFLALKVVREFLSKNHFQYLKNVAFRSYQNGVMIIFLFSQKEKFVYDEVLNSYPVVITVGEILESDKTKVVKIYNNADMKYQLMGEEFEIDAKSFLQVNKSMAEKLYKYVTNNIGEQVVINAYSGQGVLSKILSKKAKKVVGIEMQESSHLIAEKIKSPNMYNVNAKVEDVIGKFATDVDAVVLDPAREGCKSEVLSETIKANIKKIVYISCNFSTLVRDLKYLTKFYKIRKVKIFDMFPKTANLEVCLILEKF